MQLLLRPPFAARTFLSTLSIQTDGWMVTNERSDIVKVQVKFPYTLKQAYKVQRPPEKKEIIF